MFTLDVVTLKISHKYKFYKTVVRDLDNISILSDRYSSYCDKGGTTWTLKQPDV